MSRNLLVGTSGWSYDHWEGPFYPASLSASERLAFFSQHFQTVEINNSFYQLPKKETFIKWQKTVPEDFIFAVKANRFITHIKKLNNVQEPVKNFLESAQGLGKKLGPILFQFPPNWKVNLERLSKLLEFLPGALEYAFEFRHPSWFCPDTYKLLEERGVALCLADSPRWPCELKITAPYTFIRMHGGQILYGSCYSQDELKKWAERIKAYLKQDVKTYIYFNNDAYGYAVKNAIAIKKLVDEAL